MATDSGDQERDALALRAAMDAMLAGLPDEQRANIPDRLLHRWLAVGIRMGLERPGQSGRLLELIDTGGVEPAVADLPQAAAVPAAGGRDDESPEAFEQIPTVSIALARAASVPASDLTDQEPEARFAWAARLTRADILSLGGVVGDMLAAGSPADVARGFGVAWDGGVRLPRRDRDELFARFGELEVTVGGILSGHDLWAEQRSRRPTGFEALLSSWRFGSGPHESKAAAAIDQYGDPARWGLVAAWNAWVAMRYRELIERPTFEQLVRPWVTAVGPLPES
jgi:hypothetical protein